MARQSDGPKCPTSNEISDFVDLINNYITDDQDATQHEKPGILTPQLERLIEVLDWAGEQVNKRRLYSKKFQLKDKERTRLLKERLGEQYDDIVTEARSRASDQLFEEVANEQPDNDIARILEEK